MNKICPYCDDTCIFSVKMEWEFCGRCLLMWRKRDGKVWTYKRRIGNDELLPEGVLLVVGDL